MAIANGPRSTATFQLLGLVYLVTIYPFVALVGLAGGLLFMVTDVTLKLIRGQGASANSSAETKWAMRLFNWPIDQLRWIATGNGSFPALP